jgi:hypothetical protein
MFSSVFFFSEETENVAAAELMFSDRDELLCCLVHRAELCVFSV